MKKSLKKIISLILALTFVCTLLASCGTSDSNATVSDSGSSDVLARIMSDGKIKVAISLGNEPWCWKDSDGQIKGMAIDLIEGFAKSIDVEIQYDTYDFSGLIPAIQAGKDDIIATNLTRKPSRATSVLYTEPVGSSYGVVIIQKGAFSSIDKLNDSSVTLTTEVGSIYEDVGTSNFPNATMSPTENNSDALAAVKAGRADAMVTDLAIATAACAADSSIEYLTPYIYTDTLAFAVPCTSDAYTLAECFNIYLRVAKADGTYGKIYETYFNQEWVPTYTDSAM